MAFETVVRKSDGVHFLKVAAGRLTVVGADMSCQSIANAIWAMGSMGFYHEPALRTLAAQVKGES